MPKQPARKDLAKIVLVPLAIIALLFLATFNLHIYLTRNVDTEVLSYETSLDEERIFWREFLSENPNYIPGWVEYAKINYQLNNFDEASLAVEEIEKIDPNYVVSLEEYLN